MIVCELGIIYEKPKFSVFVAGVLKKQGKFRFLGQKLNLGF